MANSKGETSGKALDLYNARVASGLSLRAAAEILELTPSELGDREHGRSNPHPTEWERMFQRLAMARNTGAA